MGRETPIVPDDDADLLGIPANSNPGLPDTVTAATLAHLLGIKANRIHALARDGVMPREADKTFRLVEAVQAYAQTLRDAATGRIGEDGELAAAKLALTEANAEKVAIQNAKARGDLLDAQTVRAEWLSIAADLRARLLAVPSRVAARLSLDRPAAAALDAEIRRAMEDLSDAE